MESDPGGSARAQAAPRIHHSNKSSGPGQVCMPIGQYPRRQKTVLHKGQHENPRSTSVSIVEDLAVVAQPQLEEVGEAPPHILEGRSPQEDTETLNLLVNDGSSVGAYTLDLIAPPKSTSEITQLPTLEPKRFLPDLRSGKVKQICVLVAEDEYVADKRSSVVFTENELVLSSSSMD